MKHFVDLRILLTRSKDEMLVGKLKREILRQFQLSVPVDEPRDAEQIMDLLVVRLSTLFEKLGATAKEEPHEVELGASEGVSEGRGEGEGDSSGAAGTLQ